MHGQTVCTKHGGSAPQARAAGKARHDKELALAEATRLIRPVDIDPITALLQEVRYAAGEVQYWRGKVNGLEEPELAGLQVVKTEEGEERGEPRSIITSEAAPHLFLTLMHEASERLAKFAALAIRANVDERRVQLAESQGQVVADAVDRILGALNLTGEQRALVPVVVPRELRAAVDQTFPAGA